jgi:hypothetical protein
VLSHGKCGDTVGCAAAKLLDHAAVFDLVEHVARLAAAREAREARAAGAHAPRGHGHGERGHLAADGLDVHVAAGELLAEGFVVVEHAALKRRVVLLDQAGGNQVAGHGGLLGQVNGGTRQGCQHPR